MLALCHDSRARHKHFLFNRLPTGTEINRSPTDDLFSVIAINQNHTAKPTLGAVASAATAARPLQRGAMMTSTGPSTATLSVHGALQYDFRHLAMAADMTEPRRLAVEAPEVRLGY